MKSEENTIVAIATPPGRGGVGIIRLSGPYSKNIAEKISTQLLLPRQAAFGYFFDNKKNIIDEGILIYFKAPHSFTGEEVVELQTHGSPVVLDALLNRSIELGATLAEPGEFSKRAFLNNKIDLVQAEAIADLIDASSLQAAKSAMRSLQGDFSKEINGFVEALIQLRMYVEAAIDFPDEEVDFLSDEKVLGQLKKLIIKVKEIKASAKQGNLLKEGMHVVIVGEPNVGKSSLLNALSESETAIVTSVAGTTRDVLREQIQIDGMPLHIFDTAGLRESNDVVEKEGIKRAKKAIESADEVLWVKDVTQSNQNNFLLKEIANKKTVIIQNKIDLNNEKPRIEENNQETVVYLSAKENTGLSLLKEHLKKKMGYQPTEGVFLARKRHLVAIDQAEEALEKGLEQLTQFKAGECLAEELHIAQKALAGITGKFTSDDLLGKIFSSFCIGK